MNKNAKIHSPENTIPLLRDSYDHRYSAEITAILDYLHTGHFNFAATDALLTVADACALVLEADYCTDEALSDAIQFNHNCYMRAIDSEYYTLDFMCKEEGDQLELDPFSYYLLSIKKLPASHNLHSFRKHQYLALYILSRIIALAQHDSYAPPKAGHAPAEQLRLILKLYHIYCLLRDKETQPSSPHPPSQQENTALLADAFIKDSVSRGGESLFGARIHSAVNTLYMKNKLKFSQLSDKQVATRICENDNFLDYYFHTSTPKDVSLAAQKELSDQGYLSSVLESVRKLRS